MISLASFWILVGKAAHFTYWYRENLRSKLFFLSSQGKNGILLTELFWPTVRKNYSSDWEKLLKFLAFSLEFAKFLRSLEQFVQTVKGQNNIWVGDLVLFQILFLPFNLRINCLRDLKEFANSWPSTLNSKSLSR